MELLYQDRDIFVCIKPIGVDSEQLPNLHPDETLFTVHRLDKQVSGVMVYAKTKAAAAHLSAQMQNHQFTKEYRAVVEGVSPEPSGRWEDFLYHDKRKNKVFTVKKERKGVKHAALRYEVLAEHMYCEAQATQAIQATNAHATQQAKPHPSGAMSKATHPAPTQISLLKINLETGRTHQIRVQAASRKTPLVGDTRYGSQTKGCDIALFSHTLCFAHPRTGEMLSFTKDTPNTYPWNLFY